MTTKLTATVRRWNHNRELVSVRMVEAEPHVVRFIGDCGREHYAEEATELMNELMTLGHRFEVETVYEEASVLDFA